MIKQIAWVAFYTGMVLGGCGKSSRMGGPEGDNPSQPQEDSPESASAAQDSALGENLKITYLEANNGLKHAISPYHSLSLTIGLTAAGGALSTHIIVGLLEASGVAQAERKGEPDRSAVCVLGGFLVEHPGDGTEKRLNRSFLVPVECLPASRAEVNYVLWASGATGGIVSLSPSKDQLAGDVVTFRDVEVQVVAGKPDEIDIAMTELALTSSVAQLSSQQTHPDAQGPEVQGPFLRADLTLQAFGKPSSSGNALPEPVFVRYSIRPVDVGEQAWLALAPGQNDSSQPVRDLVPGFPHYFSSSLYLDDEGARKLGAAGEWKDKVELVLRACVEIPFEEHAGEGLDAKENNCRTLPFVMTRNPSTKAAPPRQGSYAQRVDTYAIERNWVESYGNPSTLGLTVSAQTRSALDLSGATSRSSLKASLGGLIGQMDLFEMYADLASPVAVTGSHVDVGLRMFGKNVYRFAEEQPEISLKKDFEIADQACLKFPYVLYFVVVEVDFCLTGKVGLANSFEVFSRDGAGTGIFDQSTRIGAIRGTIKPFAEFDGSATATTSVVAVRAGAEGAVNILKVEAPLVLELLWGFIQQPALVIQARAVWDLILSTLHGSLTLFAEAQTIQWCQGWLGISYPCGLQWSRVAEFPLARWPGWSMTIPLLNRFKQFVLPCLRECGQRQCGVEPGCGESCGQCTPGLTCNNSGQCIPECAECAGRECGPDPACGQSCGTCPQGFECQEAGKCVLALDWVGMPGGIFVMGCDGCVHENERVARAVTVRSFQMSRSEITQTQYRACVNAKACPEPVIPAGPMAFDVNWGKVDRGNYPMNMVNWSQAAVFCAWVGGRLPSEAEWEYAARGGGDAVLPWEDPVNSDCSCVDHAPTCQHSVVPDASGTGCGEGRTWEVCSKPLGNTKQGLCDMIGNVSEWVQDHYFARYSIAAPTDGSAWLDPTADAGRSRVLRGGDYKQRKDATCRRRYEALPQTSFVDLGFRCAR